MLSTALIFSNSFLFLLIFSTVFLCFVSFISTSVFIISFLCQFWGLICSYFSSSLRYRSSGVSGSAVPDPLWSHGLKPTRPLCPWGFSRQENWSGLPLSSPEDLLDPGIEPGSPGLQAESLPSELQGSLSLRCIARSLICSNKWWRPFKYSFCPFLSPPSGTLTMLLLIWGPTGQLGSVHFSSLFFFFTHLKLDNFNLPIFKSLILCFDCFRSHVESLW